MSSTYVESTEQWVPIEAVAEFTVDVAPPPPYVAGAAAPGELEAQNRKSRS